MMNPVTQFLQEKRGGWSANARQMPEMFGKALAGAGAAAAVGGVVASGAFAAHKLYDAATKGRDFRKMIEFNPDLAEEHARDPKMFNQLFSSLRTVNPTFSHDPVIAGTYMRRMVGSPAAGGVLTDAVTFQQGRDKTQPSIGDLVQRQAISGTKAK